MKTKPDPRQRIVSFKAHKGEGMRNKVRQKTFAEARRMRLNPTPAEAALWQQIRAEKLGVKFRRQHVIRGYIVDFYCRKHALAIEVDGWTHNKRRDAIRDNHIIEQTGVLVIRFRNDEVLRAMPMVLNAIRKAIKNSPNRARAFSSKKRK